MAVYSDEELLQRFPKFVEAGLKVPPDALGWSGSELELFLASGGLARPEKSKMISSSGGEEEGETSRELTRLALPVLESPYKLADLQGILASDSPRVIWSFWHDFSSGISPFHQLCLETWRRKNPEWTMVLLNESTVSNWLDVEKDLPTNFHELKRTQQSDSVRLALLDIYGGVWTDASNICVRALDDWCYNIVSSGDSVQDFAAFYFASWSRMYVENWFMAARRGHPFIHKWREVFNAFWSDFGSGKKLLYEHPMFQNVNLSHLINYGTDNRHYLSMHSCFAKVVQEDSRMRQIWEEEMLLLRADDSALWHIEEMGWDKFEAQNKWLHRNDTWVQTVIKQCPFLKFTFQFYMSLQFLDFKDFLFGDGCLCYLFREILGFDREAFWKARQDLEPELDMDAEAEAQCKTTQFNLDDSLAKQKFIMDGAEKLAVMKLIHHNMERGGINGGVDPLQLAQKGINPFQMGIPGGFNPFQPGLEGGLNPFQLALEGGLPPFQLGMQGGFDLNNQAVLNPEERLSSAGPYRTDIQYFIPGQSLTFFLLFAMIILRKLRNVLLCQWDLQKPLLN
eukprot:gnl/MRDRNA2_/MRDRNA2_71530_c0_seq2.p1 gnl/MRDRNA2_/MRDRNA2_71530_c0~~gnl/MRDRNA2_/MRDRNA2_71530_c0_seq2.p1  ORF type:complete len:566 (-),score=119.89 gnl/MRDRNA2_/MRDRNA2_71530_c0_seq2:13-1710(-)